MGDTVIGEGRKNNWCGGIMSGVDLIITSKDLKSADACADIGAYNI